MRTLTTPKSRSTLIYRLLTVSVAAAAISLSTFASVSRGEDPPIGNTGTPITISYFGAVTTGPNEWQIDGTLNAEDVSAVTITFGGAAAGITATADRYGYFFISLTAAGGNIVTVDATDSTSTADAETRLEEFSL